jgi:SAM-dependent methyltransferase
MNFYKDSNYCPICKKRSVFKPFGITPRPKAQCSYCGSLERHRFLWLVMKKKNVIKKNQKILHIAAELCLQNEIKKSLGGGVYLTADLRNPSAMIKMDITNIEYPEETFDVIICNHVLEHIIDDGKAMGEFKRVLKSGGVLIIMVPIRTEKTEEDFSIKTT